MRVLAPSRQIVTSSEQIVSPARRGIHVSKMNCTAR